MKNFLSYIVKRALLAAVAMFCIASVTFVLMNAVPGDPFQNETGIPKEALAQLKNYYGLDDPLSLQYVRYLRSVFCFNFGPSLRFPAQTVNEILAHSFPISLTLGFAALMIALPLGLLIGTVAYLKKNSWQGILLAFFLLLGLSIPSFVIATLLQYLFAIQFPFFPVARFGNFLHIILPSISLAIVPACLLAKLFRSTLSEVYNQPYIYIARTRGLSPFQILFFHAWKNAFLPILTYLGPLITNILIGSFAIERVFAIPGLGQWFVNGVLNRDYPVIGGLTIFYSIFLICNNTLIDLLCTLLDPRIKLDAKQSG